MSTPSSSRPLRLGLAGCGKAGLNHLHEAMACPDWELAAVCDVSRDAAAGAAKRFGVPAWYDDYETMLREQTLDAVALITPGHVHVDQAVAAAARGLHVLTEKPLGITVAECRRAAAACRAAGVLLGVTYTYHFIPDFRGMRERVDRGEIGAVREVRWLKFGGPPAEPDPVPPPPLPAHHQLARIPHLFDCGVHAFDLMSWLAGAPMVQVWGQAAAAGPGHEPESVVIVFTYADGQRGVYQMGPMTALPGADSGQPALSFHVIGTAGSLLWDYRVGWSQRQGYTTITAHTAAGTSIEQIPIYGKARDLQYAEFAAAVRAGALPGHWPTPEQAVEATRMGVEACAAIARNTVCLSDYPQPTGARRP